MRKNILIFMLLILTKLSFAELYVDVSNPAPSTQQSFNLEVTFINQDKGKYEIKGIDDFDILSKSTKTSYSYVNGKKTSLKTDMYILRAKRTGKLTLNVVTNSGEKKAVEVIVGGQVSKKVEEKIDEKFVLKTDVLEKEYYFGEKIPFEEYFIGTANISSFSVVEAAKFNDFSVKNITPYRDNNYIQNTTTYKGKPAFELILFKGILQANSSGKKTIMSSEVKVGESSRGFFNESVSYLGPKIISLNIAPLPKGAPENFKDIVGSLSSEESWNKKEVAVGEAITLKLKLYGSGNLELLDSLNIRKSESYNIFESIQKYDESIVKNRYYNEKSFEIAIVPKEAGTLKTPEILIPYFNTTTKKYEVLKIAQQEIKVTGSSVSKINSVDESIDSTPPKAEGVEISLLKQPTLPIKNIYKLAFVIVSFIAVVELFLIISMALKSRKNDKN